MFEEKKEKDEKYELAKGLGKLTGMAVLGLAVFAVYNFIAPIVKLPNASYWVCLSAGILLRMIFSCRKNNT